MALSQAGTASLLGATYLLTVTTSLRQEHSSLVLWDLQGLRKQDPTPKPPKHLTHISLKICDTEQDPAPAPGLQTRDGSPGRLRAAACAHPFGPPAWRRAAQSLLFGREHRLGGVLAGAQ